MHGTIFRLLAAIWLVCCGAAASAAEIKISDHPLYNIILEGTIVPGDYDKLRELIDENCPSKSWSRVCPSKIYLASPGGSVAEAMKIGRLVRMLRFGTEVPIDVPADLRQKIIGALKLEDPKANYSCVSACFFIAVAGIHRLPTLAGTPVLGVHRPFMNNSELRALSSNQVIASAAQVRAIVEAYLKEMGVKLKYTDLMFSIPKERIRWITSEEYESDFEGIVSELRDWLKAQCDNRTEGEKHLANQFYAKSTRGEKLSPEEQVTRRALEKKMEAEVQCEMAQEDKMREDAWKTYRGP